MKQGSLFDFFKPENEALSSQTFEQLRMFSIEKDFVVNPFEHSEELLQWTHSKNMPISSIIWENEAAWHSADEVNSHLQACWKKLCQDIRLSNYSGFSGSEIAARAQAEKMLSAKSSKTAASDPFFSYSRIIPVVAAYHIMCSGQNARLLPNRFMLVSTAILQLILASKSDIPEQALAAAMASASLCECKGATPVKCLAAAALVIQAFQSEIPEESIFTVVLQAAAAAMEADAYELDEIPEI